ncbi:MAG: hypothetical protein MZV63_05480 [Marinilabiliales bacterium]|nr:hypothetical protein [Marinilabiliales bacterium]
MQFTIEVNNKKHQGREGRDDSLGAQPQRHHDTYPLPDAGVYAHRRLQDVRCGGGRPREAGDCLFSALVEEWMKIRTHSPRVIRARKTIVELLALKPS